MAFINKSKYYDNYTVVSNNIINNPDLSGRSKWLLIYLLSKPENWKVSITDLKSHTTDGRDALYASIKELVDAGYAQKVLIRRESGKISGYDYFIYDSPFTGKPFTAKTTLVNTDSSNILYKYNVDETSTNSLLEEINSTVKPSTPLTASNPLPPKVYSNSEINLAKEWLVKKYPKALTEINDRIRLKNFIQALSRRKGRDEGMKEDWKENLVEFMAWYLKEKEGYETENLYKLNQIIQAWREKRGISVQPNESGLSGVKTVNELI